MKNKHFFNFFKSFIIVATLIFFSQSSKSQSLGFGGGRLVKKVTAINLTFNKAYVPLVSTVFDLQIEADLKNGNKAFTGNGTKNNIAWEHYSITVTGGIFSPETGTVEITDKQQVTITASLVTMPQTGDTLIIKPLEITDLNLTQTKGAENNIF